jgi:hypothetical protein
MNPRRGLAWGCALLVLGGAVTAVRADDSVFQECCNHCGPPACTSCYPTTTYYAAPRCGPIRRLFGWCCPRPVTSCRVYVPPVVTPVPACTPPCAAGVISGAPVPVPTPGATAVPNGVVPVPAAPPGGDGYDRHLTPVPETPNPPLSGSSYRPPERPLAPVPPQTLTPPRPPAPVRLDRIVSDGDGPLEATPASRTRTAPER